MIESLLSSLTNLILWFISLIISLISSPFTIIFNSIFDSFTNLESIFDNVKDFFTDYIFTGLSFCIETFCVITHFDRDLLSFIATFTTLMFTISLSLLLLKTIINVWRIIKTGKTN